MIKENEILCIKENIVKLRAILSKDTIMEVLRAVKVTEDMYKTINNN